MIEYLKMTQYKKLSNDERLEIIHNIKRAYLDDNLTILKVSNQLKINKSLVIKILQDNNIKKSKEQIQNTKEQTMLRNYGVTNVYQLDSVKERIKETSLSKYGVTNAGGSEQSIKKIKDTKLKNYGSENFVNIEKRKQTNFEKYGVECVFSNKDVQEKVKDTIFKNHNVHSMLEKEEIRQLGNNKIKEKYGVENFSYNHLSDKQISTITNKNEFYDFIMKFSDKERTPKNIADKLGISRTGIYGIIHKFNFENLFTFCNSYYEQEIETFIKSLDVDVICHDRLHIKPQEIDIFIPQFNFGIEFNGNYWHSTNNKDICYHQNKSLDAQNKGLFIYHIFEYEWDDERKRTIIKSQLRNLCHKNENKVYARNCEIREINDIRLVRQFLDNNHLQGFRNSNIKIGLFYNNELVSLLTFGKPYLNKSNKYDWELYRFCNKLNTSVIGAFDKLLKYFIQTYQPKSILTYSDFAKGTGNVYKKLHFEQLELTTPNYIWTNGNNVLSRYQTQMKDEYKIMTSKDFIKIYDCGNYKWLLTVK